MQSEAGQGARDKLEGTGSLLEVHQPLPHQSQGSLGSPEPLPQRAQLVMIGCSPRRQSFLHTPGFPGQHRRPGGAGRGGWRAVTVWAASLWPHPLAPWRPPNPLLSAKPRAGQGYTDQRGKSAFCLPGAVFQGQEGLMEAHKDLAHSPQHHQHLSYSRSTHTKKP